MSASRSPIFSGRHALPLLDHGGFIEVALGAVARLALGARFEIVEAHQRPHELHQILVGGDDQHVGARGPSPPAYRWR